MRSFAMMAGALALAAGKSLAQTDVRVIELRPEAWSREYRRKAPPPAIPPDNGQRPHQGKRERERRLRQMAKKA